MPSNTPAHFDAQSHHRNPRDLEYRNTVAGVKTYKCDRCAHGFRCRSQLAAHLRDHEEEFPFSCEECASKFRSRRELKSHRSAHGDKLYRCEHCKQCFERNIQLRKHQGDNPRMERFIRQMTAQPTQEKENVPEPTESQTHPEVNINEEEPAAAEQVSYAYPHLCPKLFKEAATENPKDSPRRRTNYKYKPQKVEVDYECEECHEGFNSNSELNDHRSGH